MAVKVGKLICRNYFQVFLEASQLLTGSHGMQATGRRHTVAILRQANA